MTELIVKWFMLSNCPLFCLFSYSTSDVLFTFCYKSNCKLKMMLKWLTMAHDMDIM